MEDIKDIKEIIKRINKLPPMPEVVNKILHMAEAPTISAKEVIEVVKYDQNITANVLRLCNSSYYSLYREVSSLSDAVVLLGNQTLYNMILASFCAGYLGKKNKGYELEKGQLWEHSVSCALLSKEIAKRVGYENEQLAYSTGLTHDSGKLVLDKFMAEEFKDVMEKLGRQNIEFNQIEEDILGITHAQAGAMLTERWKFPKEIVNAIRYHHTPEEAEGNSKVVDIVHVADALAAMFGFGSGIDGLAYRFSEKSLKNLGLAPRELYELAPVLINEIKKAKDLLELR